MGCIDMDQLWKPYPNYIGEDPLLDSNYNWIFADECLKNLYDLDIQANIRFGHSRSLKAKNPNYSKPPNDLNVFAKVCGEIVKRCRFLNN